MYISYVHLLLFTGLRGTKRWATVITGVVTFFCHMPSEKVSGRQNNNILQNILTYICYSVIKSFTKYFKIY